MSKRFEVAIEVLKNDFENKIKKEIEQWSAEEQEFYSEGQLIEGNETVIWTLDWIKWTPFFSQYLTHFKKIPHLIITLDQEGVFEWETSDEETSMVEDFEFPNEILPQLSIEYATIKFPPVSEISKGMNLGFGTEEIGRSCVELQFNNDWLTLRVSITADRGSTTIDCYDCEQSKFIGIIDEEVAEGIDEIDYNSIEGFNTSITPILHQFFSKYFSDEEYIDGNLSEFSFTGIRLDLD